MAYSNHNKYVSYPNWFESLSSATATTGTSAATSTQLNWGMVSGKPDWVSSTKPVYDYYELTNLPDLSKFITIDDVATSLKGYVTIAGNETVTGLKNFTKGIQINGLSINNSQSDVIYIDANLVVRGGVTMYALNSVDAPSILDSLPIASTTSKGIASFNSTYFSVNNGVVSIIPNNVGLNTTQLANYLTTNGYATKNWVSQLGYALSSTVTSQLATKADKATTLAGYGITDAYTKTLITNLLGGYVTIATSQTITGAKNFTGGLSVNGSPIVRDNTNLRWTLLDNLLVTGGITMYSDIRKKTKIEDITLPLDQIANAPLITYYYNSDVNKSIHVGSIAQYWAESNDWFCKKDSEDYYVMETSNLALASAISIAKQFREYKNKTDIEIQSLKNRISELEMMSKK